MNPSPLDRNDVIRSMHLGWMVLDKDNKVVDANPFVEIITGLSFDNLKGRSVEDWLVNSNILLKSDDFSQSSFLTNVNLNGFTYVFEVFSQLLRDSDNNLIGRLLLWQDVTEQRRLEDARHRVLSTKINLMRSISSAANHITDIKVFLDAAIFQIVSSFGCLGGFIFVRDSDFIGDDKAGFRLESAYSYEGLLGDSQIVKNFDKYLDGLSLDFRAGRVEAGASGLFLDDSDSGASGNLLICPIVIDESLQGAVCLFREADHPYHEDEVVGLEMITNEISMLIYVDHQRRQAVSFSERKKLVKDLHDTVTQQLYGLLYQIEVAQAHAELNDSDNLQGSLVRIADIARQALKEMRLFLHELKPVDLKKEGLISALHHRLAAVEGRANVHPRFISPESLEISTQQEINLYYIAREALNNVLRHARAKTVLVQLNQNRENTCLEVIDDGVGFDASLMENSGGMGLRNIQAWASQIHASLDVRSQPGQGTTLRIVVPKTV
jgi:PAS domain S-box-containing protein